jgi:hypothetical protein
MTPLPRPPPSLHPASSALRQVVATADAAPGTVPVGVLTGTHRDHWAETFPRLAAGNRGTLTAIAASMFALCLDDAPAATHLQVVWVGDGGEVGPLARVRVDLGVRNVFGARVGM